MAVLVTYFFVDLQAVKWYKLKVKISPIRKYRLCCPLSNENSWQQKLRAEEIQKKS